MSLSSHAARAPLTATLAFLATSTTAIAQESETPSFTCDVPNGITEWDNSEKIRHMLAGSVFIQTKQPPKKIDEQGQPPGIPLDMEEFLRRFFNSPPPSGEQSPENSPETTPEEAPEESLPETPRREETQEGEDEPDMRPDPQGGGSGTIIDPRGYITTNNHVVENAEEIRVTFFAPDERDTKGETVEATLIGTDQKTDIAVIKVEMDTPLPCSAFGDSMDMYFGDTVRAIGNPLGGGQSFSLSQGIVSHPLRNGDMKNAFTDYIQTDAAINRGNSGGSLYNDNAEIIGMNTAIKSLSGGSNGIGFAIHGNTIVDVADAIIRDGEKKRGMLGIHIKSLDGENNGQFNLPADLKGVLIAADPASGLPGHDAGLLGGDVIIESNGAEVEETFDLIRSVSSRAPGDSANLTIIRNGEVMEIDLVLGDRNEIEARMNEQQAEAFQRQMERQLQQGPQEQSGPRRAPEAP